MTSPNLPALIAEVRRLDAAATNGPWTRGIGSEYRLVRRGLHETVAADCGADNGNLIAEYRTAAPLLAAECSRLQAEVTQLRAERDMPCAHRLEEERLQERVRVLEAALRTVLAGDPDDSRRPYEKNAPGHAHWKPGIWDRDNGERAGKPCEWCAAWHAAHAALEGIEVE
jgi:hypothetical protein